MQLHPVSSLGLSRLAALSLQEARMNQPTQGLHLVGTGCASCDPNFEITPLGPHRRGAIHDGGPMGAARGGGCRRRWRQRWVRVRTPIGEFQAVTRSHVRDPRPRRQVVLLENKNAVIYGGGRIDRRRRRARVRSRGRAGVPRRPHAGDARGGGRGDPLRRGQRPRRRRSTRSTSGRSTSTPTPWRRTPAASTSRST